MCPDRGLHFVLLGCWCVPAADHKVFRWRRWGRAARGMRVFGWCWGWGCDGRPASAARGESPRTPCPSPLWPPQWTAQVRRRMHTSHVNAQPFTTHTEPHPAHIYNTHRATPSTHLQHTQSHTQHTSTTHTEPHPAHIYNTHRATPSTYHTFTQPKADQSSAHQGSINYAHTYIKTKVVSASSFKYLYITFPNQEPSTPHETGFNFSPKHPPWDRVQFLPQTPFFSFLKLFIVIIKSLYPSFF